MTTPSGPGVLRAAEPGGMTAFRDVIRHGALDVEALYGDRTVLPFGTGADGAVVGYPLSDTVAPHGLVAGPTGAGTSSLLRLLAIEAARQGVEVHGCDPKRIELMGLRGWPNVRIAASIPGIIQLIGDDCQEMHRRYAAIETGQARASDFRRILLIVDAYLVVCMLVGLDWSATRDKHGPREHPVIRQIGELATFARAARMNLVLGGPRAESFLSGAARDNFGFRVSLGRLARQAAQMLWGDAHTGTDLPCDVPGLGTATTPDGPRPVKVHYVPDPAGDLTAEDMLQLRSLLPPGASWDGPLSRLRAGG